MICTKWDDWLREYYESKTMWTCELTDGTIVYQDDDRPGTQPESAWLRLKSYCENNGLGIEFMRIQFRSHIKDVGRGADAFFFCKSVLGGMMMVNNVHFYIVGTIENGHLVTNKWQVPSLLLHETEERCIEDYHNCLIWKPEKKQEWLAKNPR